MQGMETAYVETGVSSGNTSTTVGTEVIKAVAQKYQTNNQIGKATIEIDGFGTIDNVTGDATVSIYTTDFEVEGTITLNDGILTWGEMEELTPGLTLKTTSLILAPGEEGIIRYKVRGVDGNISWMSDNEKIIVENGVVTIDGTAGETDIATITASIGEYTKTCLVTVQEKWNDATIDGLNNMIGTEIANNSYVAKDIFNKNVSAWQIFYAEGTEVFIISTEVLEKNTAIGGTDTTSNEIEYENGAASLSLAAETYGRKYNSVWFAVANMPEVAKTDGVVNNNAKTVAYLCDTTKWTRYAVSGIANYAVGGPTIELLAKSVKAHGGTDYTTQLTATGTGYNNPITSDLEVPYNKASFWWLASPMDTSDDGILRVGKNGAVEGGVYNGKNNKGGIRPLVSIPLFKVKVKGTQVKIIP